MEEKSSFYKKVTALVMPIALQNLINVGISAIDVMMLGRVGEDALSGASLGGQVNFIMSLFLFGLMSGASVLIAQYWGKKDMESIKTVFGMAMKISVAVSILFFVLTLAMPEQLMGIFTNEQAVIEQGTEYLKYVCWSYLLIPIAMTYLNTMRSMEKVVIATVVYLSSMVTNIVANAILIFGLFGCPAMGVKGAAIGTVLARVVELLIVLIHNTWKNDVLPFKIEYLFRKDKLLQKDFLYYSVPVMANELFWGAGVSSISAVLGHMGSAVVAANSVTQVVRQLALVISFGVSAATSIMLGKEIGAGNRDRAEAYGKNFLILSFLTGLLGTVVVLITRPIVVSALVLTPDAQKYLNFMMYIMSYFVVGQSVNSTIVVGICRSGGDTKFGLVLDIVFMWGVAIIGGFLSAFVFKWGVYVTYIILLSDEIVKIPVTLWRYRTKKWLKDVTR